jgi:hypothetical protein
MPEPVYGDVHVAAALTDVAVAYLQDEAYYIADKIFPLVPVQWPRRTGAGSGPGRRSMKMKNFRGRAWQNG